MRITKVRTHLLTSKWTEDPWFPPMLHSAAVVRIETDAKLDGLGESTLGYFAPESVPALVEYFEPILIGQDPMEIGRLSRAMYDDAVFWARSGSGRSVISGIELALWDLAGKALGLPVYRLLGGKVRERVPVYASGGPACWPISENLRKVENYAEQGYRAAKISTDFYEMQTPHGDESQRRLQTVPLSFAHKVERLAEAFEKLRAKFGGEMDLAVDGHQGGVPDPMPVTEAVAIAQALGPYRLRFFEEPLAYTDLPGYSELRRRSPIPIAGGESLCGVDQFHGLIAGHGVDLVQPDLGFVGGLQETIRIVHHAEAFNLGTALHTGASVGPVLAASWHLAAATGSVAWLEHALAARSIQRDVMRDDFSMVDGMVSPPTSPGLGVHLPPEILEKYRFIPGSGERT